MKRHIQKAGMELVDVKSFSILHSESSAIRQINVARSKLGIGALQNDPSNSQLVLKQGMESYLNDLE